MNDTRDWFYEIADEICANIHNKKLVLWGFYQTSLDLSTFLDDKYNIEVDLYVDGNRDLVDERKVFSPEILAQNCEEYYVVIPLAYNSYISRKMKEWGYGENDYFYFNDCIIQYDSELYIDRHGNKVVRPPENMKLAFMGYDNYIEFAEEYSYFSKVTLTAKSDNRLVVEANGSYRDTRIYLGEGNEVIFGDGSSIMNSTITLCDYNRFLLEKNNRIQDTQIQLFRENVFDLIAIIPFSALFRIFRLARFVRVLRFMRLFRAAAISTRFLARLRGLLDTNGFKYMLILSVGAILASAAAMMYVEGMSFMDALWWSFVTATTVGYGDLSPSSGAGRIIAAGLMIVGIGLIGSLTSSITSFFLVKDTDKAYSSDRVEMVAAMYKMLSDEEKESFRKTCIRSDEVQIESARTGHQ